MRKVGHTFSCTKNFGENLNLIVLLLFIFTRTQYSYMCSSFDRVGTLIRDKLKDTCIANHVKEILFVP